MRYGQRSQLALLDCTSSRRSTVMCALPWATEVTSVYQRDSSSKRPRASVVFAAHAPEMSESGPGVRFLTRTLLCEQADACPRTVKPRSTSRVDRGSFHIT